MQNSQLPQGKNTSVNLYPAKFTRALHSAVLGLVTGMLFCQSFFLIFQPQLAILPVRPFDWELALTPLFCSVITAGLFFFSAPQIIKIIFHSVLILFSSSSYTALYHLGQHSLSLTLGCVLLVCYAIYQIAVHSRPPARIKNRAQLPGKNAATTRLETKCSTNTTAEQPGENKARTDGAAPPGPVFNSNYDQATTLDVTPTTCTSTDSAKANDITDETKSPDQSAKALPTPLVNSNAAKTLIQPGTTEPLIFSANGKSRLSHAAETVVLVLIILFFILHLVFHGGASYFQAKSYNYASFDHGIFVQALESIAQNALPLTTLERGYELSHFAVHFSPVLYLIFPFYLIARSSAWLNLLQVMIVLSALIPLNFWLRNNKTPLLCRRLILLLYLTAPAEIFSSNYGFHENCCLPLAIFTYMYFHSKGKLRGIIPAAFLILFVKEDAFIYLAAISLTFLFRATKKQDRPAIFRETFLLSLSLIYFLTVSQMMQTYGLGTMSGRFIELIPPQAQPGFVAVLTSIWQQPAAVLNLLCTPEKLTYLGIVFGGVALAPLWNKQLSTLFLLVPLFFVNLLSNWPYQVNLNFQYHYGSFALLMIILTLAIQQYITTTGNKIKFRIIATLIILAVIFNITFSTAKILPNVRGYLLKTQTHLATASKIETAIAQIPSNSTLAVSTFLTPATAKFRYVYDINYLAPQDTPLGKTDYLVIDQRFALSDKTKKTIAIIESQYLATVFYTNDAVKIYRLEH